MFVEKILETKAKGMKVWPVHSNRASEMGHECLRYLVFNRTRWEEKTLPPPDLKLVFDIGNDIEKRLIFDLMEAGIQVLEQQRPFHWKEYQISGAIDLKLLEVKDVYPAEIKSCSPFVFDGLTDFEAMKKHKYHYMRKYPAQLTLYLLMDNKEKGLFIFKDKVRGRMKEIWADLDYEYGESLVQKAEKINTHVKEGTIPDPIEWQDSICEDCGFLHVCLPDRIGQEMKVIDDAELEELIKRWFDLKPIAKEYDEVDSELSAAVKNRTKIIVGDFLITGKQIDTKAGNSYWKKSIARI